MINISHGKTKPVFGSEDFPEEVSVTLSKENG